ncbi:MAG: hypothetical protein U9R60_13430 [Bacteroidota bacterium]|nr:hypothetical protein [Bacteroidota bacterium]
MKCTHRIILPAIVIILLFSTLNLGAQLSHYLPENIRLSFNGKFIPAEADADVKFVSDNGLYKVKYNVRSASDEMRKITGFELFRNDELMYSLNSLPGSDIYVSNAGYLAVMDMKFHYQQELSIHVFSPEGLYLFSDSFKYASLFAFSPRGEKFVVGTDRYLYIISLIDHSIRKVNSCSQFAFSADEAYLATARENKLIVYKDYKVISSFNTGLFYPRGLAIHDHNLVTVIGKKKLKTYAVRTNQEVFADELPEHQSYRDLHMETAQILAGVHYRHDGVSRGILKVYDLKGRTLAEEEHSTKFFKTFEAPQSDAMAAPGSYDQIPWPFEPFDEVHKVWNHYEQHMGDGSGDWGYLHQGLDIEVPVNEPAYAVEAGWVKLMLTLGGDLYWRVAGFS